MAANRILVKCACKARLKVPLSARGGAVRCCVCAKITQVPGEVPQAPSDANPWIRVRCECGKVIKAPVDWAGEQGECPRCLRGILMPTLDELNKEIDIFSSELSNSISGTSADGALFDSGSIVMTRKELSEKVNSMTVDSPLANDPKHADSKSSTIILPPPTSILEAAKALEDSKQPSTEASAPLPAVAAAPAASAAVSVPAASKPPIPEMPIRTAKTVSKPPPKTAAALTKVKEEVTSAPPESMSIDYESPMVLTAPGISNQEWDRKRRQKVYEKIKRRDGVLAAFFNAVVAVIRSPAAFQSPQWVNSPPVIGFFVVMLVISLTYIVFAINPGDPPTITKIYYYDMGTGKLFVGADGQIPPIPAPSGKKSEDGQDVGVQAFVFACGDCNDETSRYVGYLSILSPDAKAAHDKGEPIPSNADSTTYGRLIMSPDDSKSEWVSVDSPAGLKVLQKSASKCDGSRYAIPCFPPQ